MCRNVANAFGQAARRFWALGELQSAHGSRRGLGLVIWCILGPQERAIWLFVQRVAEGWAAENRIHGCSRRRARVHKLLWLGAGLLRKPDSPAAGARVRGGAMVRWSGKTGHKMGVS